MPDATAITYQRTPERLPLIARDSRRIAGRTALTLSCFALGWFAWGQAEASGALSAALAVGSVASLLVAVLGAIATFARAPAAGAMRDTAPPPRYGRVIAIEFALIGTGVLMLGAMHASAYIPVWVCALVGLHFFPLASAVGAPALRWLGAAVSAVAGAALLVGLLSETAPSSVTGAGAGLALLAFATLVLAGPTSSIRRHAGSRPPAP
jgi:hypothetical protein